MRLWNAVEIQEILLRNWKGGDYLMKFCQKNVPPRLDNIHQVLALHINIVDDLGKLSEKSNPYARW